MRTARIRLVLAAGLVSAACAARETHSVTPEPTAAPPPFTAPLGRDHPLAGRLFDVATRAERTPDQLIAQLRDARFILLGERHDHPDHHALQASVVSALAATGRRPAVAFEMLHEGQQEAASRSLEAAPRDAEALAKAVRWTASGWPAFELYRPVFVAVLDGGLDLRAANLAPERVRAAAMGTPDRAALALLARAATLGDVGRSRLAAQIDRNHCGHAQPAMIDAMVEAQRLRDAAMAEALIAADAGGADGAVLIAGAGHVARDHGVPVQLAARVPDARTVSVAFLEVREEIQDPFESDPAADSGEAVDAFDVVWFTPRLDDDDPCLKYRDALEGMRSAHPKR